ncbi:hypothetical protein RMDY18_14130 [Rothia mucilaginosa DY-18]|uniref:Uncharacterized protein n=1 Tax=Rothia mucilaginosa (strain DY-18) TaxID=680646 RepID=D2NUB9_ROTMD|nr:hypothetical protein RMDY18_14130 [Rothia mucilaginosa DY-18]
MYRESQKRLDKLYSTLVLLATANHRKTTVQQIILRNSCVLALNLHAVHRSAALLQNATSLRVRLRKAQLSQNRNHVQTIRRQLSRRKLSNHRLQGSLIQSSEIALTEQSLRSSHSLISSLSTVNQRSHQVRQSLLSLTLKRFLLNLLRKLSNLSTSQESKDLQTIQNIRIRSVQPELVESVRRAHLRVQPNSVTLALTELSAIRVSNQRSTNSVNALTLHTARGADTS